MSQKEKEEVCLLNDNATCENEYESSESSALSEEEKVEDLVKKEMKNVSKAIDRNEEDQLVTSYKKTKDEKVLLKLYNMREHTLGYLTKKFSYLSEDPESLFSELRSVWYRCVEHYDHRPQSRMIKDKFGKLVINVDGLCQQKVKKTSFNTFLYTSLIYCVRNIVKKKYSKKRTDINGIPFNNLMTSADEDIGGKNSDDSFSLHDILPAKGHHSSSRISTDEIIDLFSDGDVEIRNTLRLLAYDPGVKRLSTAARLKCGSLKIDKKEQTLLIKGSKRAIKYIRSRIKNEHEPKDDFKLMSYQVFSRKVKYEILTRNMNLFNRIVKKVKSKRHSSKNILS
jgi:hypothetical protein